MNVAALVADLERAGVEVTVASERLRCRAPKGVMTEAMVDALRRNKADVIAALEARLVSATAPAEWGDAAAAVEWVLASAPPAQPFVMVWNDQGTRPAITITDPTRFWRDLRTDVAAGLGTRRDKYGAVRADLKRLHAMFNTEAMPPGHDGNTIGETET